MLLQTYPVMIMWLLLSSHTGLCPAQASFWQALLQYRLALHPAQVSSGFCMWHCSHLLSAHLPQPQRTNSTSWSTLRAAPASTARTVHRCRPLGPHGCWWAQPLGPHGAQVQLRQAHVFLPLTPILPLCMHERRIGVVQRQQT